MSKLKIWIRGWLGLYEDQTAFVAQMNELHENVDSLKAQIDGINAGLSSLYNRLEKEIDTRRSESALFRDNVKALREFVVGCAEFSDKVVVRVGKIEKAVKRGKKTKRIKG